MPERNQIYLCELCGNLVEIIAAGAGDLVCCGESMKLMSENTGDGVHEKHVPVCVDGTDGGIVVKVGSQPHPMTPEHYIEWIEVVNGPYVNRKRLVPGDAPEAEFYVPFKPGLLVRAYCNKHGLYSMRTK